MGHWRHLMIRLKIAAKVSVRTASFLFNIQIRNLRKKKQLHVLKALSLCNEKHSIAILPLHATQSRHQEHREKANSEN
jgi:hypothetical protein